ncbi:MAG: DUF2330 domain-containing protein [bacterium]|nr:DUF2330 domain-containing protein [bacterium]
MNRTLTTIMAWLVAFAPTLPALADPCGMVPPIYLGQGRPIERIGVQKTYVFYKDGIESIVIRPGFAGKVDEFGMLIPFPSPPAIRKVADDVFPHIAAAVDPPEVVVDLHPGLMFGHPSGVLAVRESSLHYRCKDAEQVRVIREEAVGMYAVAVLEAGSAQALKVWMDDHGFRYPDGMDRVCEDYVEQGWCFVAVKARVGQKAGADPRPGMQGVDTDLPADARFDGHVQAMGFRFRTEEFVVPMRLSAFNAGELRNIVYILSDGPKRIANLSEGFVVRQVPGSQLYRNLTDPLPLRVLGGSIASIPDWRRNGLPQERNPIPHNGIARDVFASDLLAVRSGRLEHRFEEMEKQLLDVGERLGLRGPELDALHREALAAERERAVQTALGDLIQMTLTVVDGDFPRDVIAADNLKFSAYTMPAPLNAPQRYDAKHEGPAPALGGFVTQGAVSGARTLPWLFAIAAGAYAICLVRRASAGRRRVLATVVSTAVLGLIVLTPPQAAQTPVRDTHSGCKATDVIQLLAQAREGTSLIARGRAIASLAERGGEAAERGLRALQDARDTALVRIWASAALVRLADSSSELAVLSARTASDPVLVRPVASRWLALLRDSNAEVALADVLEALGSSYPLQQRVLPGLLERPTAEFLDVMVGADAQNARNQAAACIATLQTQGREGLAAAVLARLKFDAEAKNVPWSGGPLFLPSLPWTKEEGRALARALISWHVWCERNGLHPEQLQIHNNLNSWALANAAGYPMPSRVLDSTSWLFVFADMAGAVELGAMLAELGLDEKPLYKVLLELITLRQETK